MTFVSLPALVFTHLNSFICQRTGRSQVVVFIFSFGFKCILRDGGRSISHQEKCPAVDGQFQRRKHRVESGGIIEEQARASAAIEYKIPHVISMLFFYLVRLLFNHLKGGKSCNPQLQIEAEEIESRSSNPSRERGPIATAENVAAFIHSKNRTLLQIETTFFDL